MKKSVVITIVCNVILALICLLIGRSIAGSLAADSQRPDRSPPPFRGELVEVVEVGAEEHSIEIQTRGEVVPARESVLQSEVSGRIDFLHPRLERGGFVPAGERLLEIDRRQYRLLVEAREGQLEQAEAAQEIEEGLGELAEDEWDRFSERYALGGDASLALREPQQRNAEASLEVAEANVDLAELDLRRTRIDAPYDAYIRMESVEEDMLVSPGMQLATLVATDVAWIEVSVPVERLDMIDIPGVNASTGSSAVVRVSGVERNYEGRVLRLLADLDPAGRMARVLVEVQDPWGLQLPESERGLPLFLGAYADVRIQVSQPVQGIEIPRYALRNGTQVWVYDDGELRIREVEMAWRRESTVIVSAGLDAGDELVTSRIGIPVEGMQLRRPGDEPPETAEDAPAEGEE